MGRLPLRLIPAARVFQSGTSGQAWSPLIPLAIYAITRFVSAVMILSVADAKHFSYGDLVTAWDGNRYRQITIHGYPPALPVDDNGKVVQNSWAFSPLYPLLVRTVMTLTGLGYNVAAPWLSLRPRVGAR